MPPRHTYWTIILDGKPTAFRAAHAGGAAADAQAAAGAASRCRADVVRARPAVEVGGRVARGATARGARRAIVAARRGARADRTRIRARASRSPRDEKRRRFRERLFGNDSPDDQAVPVDEATRRSATACARSSEPRAHRQPRRRRAIDRRYRQVPLEVRAVGTVGSKARLEARPRPADKPAVDGDPIVLPVRAVEAVAIVDGSPAGPLVKAPAVRIAADTNRPGWKPGGEGRLEAESARAGPAVAIAAGNPVGPRANGTGGGDRGLETQSARWPRHRRWRSRLETQSTRGPGHRRWRSWMEAQSARRVKARAVAIAAGSPVAPQVKAPVAAIAAGNPVGPAGPAGGERRPRVETKSACRAGRRGGDRGWKPGRPPGKPAGDNRGWKPTTATGSAFGFWRRPWTAAARRRRTQRRRGRIVAMIAHVVLFKPKHELTGRTSVRPCIDDLKAAASGIPSIRALRVGQRIRHGRPGYEQADARGLRVPRRSSSSTTSRG